MGMSSNRFWANLSGFRENPCVKQQDEDVSEEFVAMIFCLKIYIVLLGYPEFGIQWENLHRKPMGFEVPSQFSLQWIPDIGQTIRWLRSFRTLRCAGRARLRDVSVPWQSWNISENGLEIGPDLMKIRKVPKGRRLHRAKTTWGNNFCKWSTNGFPHWTVSLRESLLSENCPKTIGSLWILGFY